MPKIYNKRSGLLTPSDAVYIGRPSKWGNPFEIGRDGTRAEVIEKYRAYINARPQLCLDAINELKGKDLVCWCAPKQCHGEVLMLIANGGGLGTSNS